MHPFFSFFISHQEPGERNSQFWTMRKQTQNSDLHQFHTKKKPHQKIKPTPTPFPTHPPSPSPVPPPFNKKNVEKNIDKNPANLFCQRGVGETNKFTYTRQPAHAYNRVSGKPSTDKNDGCRRRGGQRDRGGGGREGWWREAGVEGGGGEGRE